MVHPDSMLLNILKINILKIIMQSKIPVSTLTPSFCHVITGRGVPTASHGNRTGLLRITSSVPGWTLIDGGSKMWKST